MDTNLGAIELTEKQIANFDSLKTENIKGFSYWNDSKEVVCVSETEIDVDAVKALVQALPDEYPQSYYENNFSFHLLMGRLNQTLAPASILKLAPYTGALESYCDWKNFSGVKQFLDALLSVGTLTAEELVIISDCFSEQNIHLNDYVGG